MDPNKKPKVILGVTESDAHIVANHVIAFMLREHGFDVINAGACTPISEFITLNEKHPDAMAMLIGSLNGHACQDLEGLRTAKDEGRITCPIVIGGNLSVGCQKAADVHDRVRALGADFILQNHMEILPLLKTLQRSRKAGAATRVS